MRLSYISQIKANIKKSAIIHTNKPSSNILDGSYISLHKGRSMNFDALREYVPGDDVKDIDWKATSRTGDSNKVLVREFIAEKKHNIMFVLDTNRRMLASSKNNVEKREIVTYSMGTLAYLISCNGDYISASFCGAKSLKHFPFKGGLYNIESILSSFKKETNSKNNSDINKALDFVMRNFRRRMIVVIFTDMEGARSISEQTLKRFVVRHDVLLVDISDSDAFGKDIYDVEEGAVLPEFITSNKAIMRREKERKAQIITETNTKLKRAGVTHSTFDDYENIDIQLTSLLNKHKLEKT